MALPISESPGGNIFSTTFSCNLNDSLPSVCLASSLKLQSLEKKFFSTLYYTPGLRKPSFLDSVMLGIQFSQWSEWASKNFQTSDRVKWIEWGPQQQPDLNVLELKAPSAEKSAKSSCPRKLISKEPGIASAVYRYAFACECGSRWVCSLSVRKQESFWITFSFPLHPVLMGFSKIPIKLTALC